MQPLSMNAVSLMLTRSYHAGEGSLRAFGSHRIRHPGPFLLPWVALTACPGQLIALLGERLAQAARHAACHGLLDGGQEVRIGTRGRCQGALELDPEARRDLLRRDPQEVPEARQDRA